MKKHYRKYVLYINREDGNEATLNKTVEDLTSGVSDVTWQEWLETPAALIVALPRR